MTATAPSTALARSSPPSPSQSGSNGGSGGCVEVAVWRKSSYSSGGTTGCVEVGDAATGVLVRDTTHRAGAVLAIPAAWRTLLAEIHG